MKLPSKLHLSFELSLEEKAFLKKIGTPLIIKKWNILFHQDDPADKICIIQSGSAQVSIKLGGKIQILGHVGPGDIVGEMGFFELKRTATIEALEDMECLAIPFTSIEEYSSLDMNLFHEIKHIILHRVQSNTKILKKME